MKIKRLVIGIVCFCLLGAYIARVIQVNREIPDTVVSTCKKGETIDFEGIRYRIAGVEWADKEETNKRSYDADRIKMEGDYKTIVVDLEATNITDSEMNFEAYEFCIEGNGFTNGVNATYMFDKEEDNSRTARMKPGEIRHFKLPYFCAEAMVRPDVWNDIESKEFKLIVSLYPEKIELII